MLVVMWLYCGPLFVTSLIRAPMPSRLLFVSQSNVELSDLLARPPAPSVIEARLRCWREFPTTI